MRNAISFLGALLFACLLLTSIGVRGQSYIPLLSAPSSSWQDEKLCGSPGPNTSSYECIRYDLEGDSIVDGMTYRVLTRTGRRSWSYSLVPEMNSIIWYDREFAALLREDTLERRVFIRPAGWPMDRLLYDFSADVGPYPDTYLFDWDMTVTSVDTIWLGDVPRRRMNFGDYLAVIEGVGSTAGFMPSGVSGEYCAPQHLVCHVFDGDPIYVVNSSSCACGSNVSIGTNPDEQLRIGPSPTTGMSWLAGARPNAPYQVMDMKGTVVLSGVCSQSGSAILDLTYLSSGTYLIEVVTPDSPLRTKIIKR